MNKITKIFLVILSTVSFTLSQVSAGELAVTRLSSTAYLIMIKMQEKDFQWEINLHFLVQVN